MHTFEELKEACERPGNDWLNDAQVSIPEARKLMAQSTDPLMVLLAPKLRRRSAKYPTARATRKSLTPALAADIRDYKDINPELSNRVVGRMFGVDGGRVSEAIHHKM